MTVSILAPALWPDFGRKMRSRRAPTLTVRDRSTVLDSEFASGQYLRDRLPSGRLNGAWNARQRQYNISPLPSD